MSGVHYRIRQGDRVALIDRHHERGVGRESQTEILSGSPYGEPNSTKPARTPATSSPSKTSSPTMPSSYTNKAAASPKPRCPAK